jgi:hypothetical protein
LAVSSSVTNTSEARAIDSLLAAGASRRKSTAPEGSIMLDWKQFVRLTDEQLADCDIAVVNLACAADLPGGPDERMVAACGYGPCSLMQHAGG